MADMTQYQAGNARIAPAQKRDFTMRHLLIRKAALPTGVSVMAIALGALAVGALAIGALAIGHLAIKRMALEKAKIRDLEIEDLTIRRLKVIEPIQASQVTE
jgi:hypothetical protein